MSGRHLVQNTALAQEPKGKFDQAPSAPSARSPSVPGRGGGRRRGNGAGWGGPANGPGWGGPAKGAGAPMRDIKQANALRAAIPPEVKEARLAEYRARVIWALDLYGEIARNPSTPDMAKVRAITAFFRLMERIGAI